MPGTGIGVAGADRRGLSNILSLTGQSEDSTSIALEYGAELSVPVVAVALHRRRRGAPASGAGLGLTIFSYRMIKILIQPERVPPEKTAKLMFRVPNTSFPHPGGESPVTAKLYLIISGILFAMVAVAHLARLLFGWTILVDTEIVPMWVSWVGFLVPGGLSVWAFRLASGD